ncbi:RNA polymerase sigma factor [Sphingopyxis sp.]|uniref:RNA polymerase sigma factor n=1 Tax=Sphingopyxis sp. TaxID=1908224 RepID=UPI003D6CD29B
MTEAEQDRAFSDTIARFGGAIARMARGDEADADLRRDLEQDIQVALWQSLARFDARYALSTWVWRVAHIIARRRHSGQHWANIEDIDLATDDPTPFERVTSEQAMALILSIIDRLDPPDRQILLLYLEGVAAAEAGEITGVSPEGVATNIHRFKTMLTRCFALTGDAS